VASKSPSQTVRSSSSSI